MKISISLTSTTRVRYDINIHSLEYDFKDETFYIPAGGYLIKPREIFSPQKVLFIYDSVHVFFGNDNEASSFHNWLLEADKQAKDSFGKMLD